MAYRVYQSCKKTNKHQNVVEKEILQIHSKLSSHLKTADRIQMQIKKKKNLNYYPPGIDGSRKMEVFHILQKKKTHCKLSKKHYG